MYTDTTQIWETPMSTQLFLNMWQRVKPAGPGISRGREITVGLANFVLPGAQPGVFYINQNSLSPIPAPPFKVSAFDTGNKQCIA